MPAEFNDIGTYLLKRMALRGAVTRLCTYVAQGWRTRERLEATISDIKETCIEVMKTLSAFVEFSSGAFVNASRSSCDPELPKRLAHLLRPLRDSQEMLKGSLNALQQQNWQIVHLTRPSDTGNDELDRFIAIAKTTPEDARQVAAFIQGNSRILFSAQSGTTQQTDASCNGGPGPAASSQPGTDDLQREPPNIARTESSIRRVQSRPLPTPPLLAPNNSYNGSDCGTVKQEETPNVNGIATGTPADTQPSVGPAKQNVQSDTECSSLFDDYDFIESGAGPTRLLREQQHPQDAVNGYEMPRGSLEDHESSTSTLSPFDPSSTPNEQNGSAHGAVSPTTAYDYPVGFKLYPEDKQIFVFYADQVDHHIETLCSAIDGFLATVERNDQPKIFVNHSKFIILAAHKLVYVADSIAQCIKDASVASRVKDCSDQLCDVLKFSVAATKQAAIQYPSVPSIQAMVDGVVNISHAAQRIKVLIQRSAML